MKTEDENVELYGGTRGNAPRRWQDYLMYPRVLFTGILVIISVVLHIAFVIYVWVFEK